MHNYIKVVDSVEKLILTEHVNVFYPPFVMVILTLLQLVLRKDRHIYGSNNVKSKIEEKLNEIKIKILLTSHTKSKGRS